MSFPEPDFTDAPRDIDLHVRAAPIPPARAPKTEAIVDRGFALGPVAVR